MKAISLFFLQTSAAVADTKIVVESFENDEHCEGKPKKHTYTSGLCAPEAGTSHYVKMTCDADNAALHYQRYTDWQCKNGATEPGTDGAKSITSGVCRHDIITNVGQIYTCGLFPKVIVSYIPGSKELGGIASKCGPDVDAYRLVMSGTPHDEKSRTELMLVAVKGEKAVRRDLQPTLVPFEVGYSGIFDNTKGRKKCVSLASNYSIQVNDNDGNPCTSENKFGDEDASSHVTGTGAWKFKQWPNSEEESFCMPDIHVLDKGQCKLLIHQYEFPRVALANSNSDDCDRGWQITRFTGGPVYGKKVDEAKTAAVEQPSCKKCFPEPGTFSCSTPEDGCALAPDPDTCAKNNGTWCGSKDGTKIIVESFENDEHCEGKPTTRLPYTSSKCQPEKYSNLYVMMICDADNAALHYQRYTDSKCKILATEPGHDGAKSITSGVCKHDIIPNFGQIYTCGADVATLVV